MGDNALVTSVTTILAIGAAFLSINAVRRTDFERARNLHQELTTKDVADARDIVGSALENPARAPQVHLQPHEIKAFFTVLWCFERLDVARGTLLGRFPWIWGSHRWRPLWRWINPRLALDESIRVHVQIYAEYLDKGHIDGQPIRQTLKARATDAGLQRLAKTLELGQPTSAAHLSAPRSDT